LNILPYKEDIAAVLGEVIASHKVDEKKEIWSARSIDFDGKEGYTPVVVGIWDSGVDVNVFAPSQRFTNPKEKPDNKDDDGNGFVDDIHGIAFDIDHEKTTGLLYPLGDQEKNRRELEDQAKGFTDLNAAVDSPEATEIKKKLSGLSPDAVKPFIESLGLYSFHAHGTHVAGIALAGDPYARVLVARLTFDHRMVPRPFTMEMLEKFAKECGEVVEYFKENNVRVVNMSWGFSISEIESNLEVNGIGATAEERAEMARKMFQVVNRALYKAMNGAPNILFVAAAGNSNNNVEFDEFIPSGYDLPNLIVAGAVDQAGDPTSFTSFGKTVVIYANGFEVESYVPGGRRIAFSGTSMASPNVANLAAKLVARDEKLEPSQVIDLIVGGADLMGEDKKLPVMNPKRSLELLEKEISSR
jgi:subtilisin family serine protease